MRTARTRWLPVLALLLLCGLGPVLAQGPSDALVVQCPGDADEDAIIDGSMDDPFYAGPDPYFYPTNDRCMHISGGDGYIRMADGRPMYMFGFGDLTGTPVDLSMVTGSLGAAFPAPPIVVDQWDDLYLTLTNVGMVMRPDLFDPHTVHYHGFPEAASVFDGVPESSISINTGASLTYYYKNVQPGTYMYHCHVEATEHMQMGMLGNLYVRPEQNRLPHGTMLGTHVHSNPDYNVDRNRDDPLVGDKYVYNDGDGSTRYDVEYPIQLGSFASNFHDASETVQALPFAEMKDDYAMLNGRGYPDTINPGVFTNAEGKDSQVEPSLMTVATGQRMLIRLSNLNVTRYYTVTSGSLPMLVVGKGAKLLRGRTGANLYYTTTSIDIGGGESFDVIVDTTGVAPGTYFLYTTNLNYLNNKDERFGGMMTEIVVTP